MAMLGIRNFQTKNQVVMRGGTVSSLTVSKVNPSCFFKHAICIYLVFNFWNEIKRENWLTLINIYMQLFGWQRIADAAIYKIKIPQVMFRVVFIVIQTNETCVWFGLHYFNECCAICSICSIYRIKLAEKNFFNVIIS